MKFKAQMKSAWSQSIFFVVLVKVGLDEINAEYIPCIKELLTYPESVGMIGKFLWSSLQSLSLGGRPGNAYYFVGYQDDELIYLDPHFVQVISVQVQSSDFIKDSCLTKHDLTSHKDTYFCNKPRTVHVSKIDTSIALGFYIENAKDFSVFMKRLRETANKSSAFFGLEKYSPNFDDLSDENMSFSDEDNEEDGEYAVL